jgi:PAS domain S-box-containing protein
LSGRPVFDDAGQYLGFRGVGIDTTDAQRHLKSIELRDRALESLTEGVVITDFARPDNPIIYVNDAFTKLTGYAREDVIGRNCRFLQGDSTDQEGLTALRSAIANGEPATVRIRNQRKDGAAFLNELRLSPVRDDSGRVTHFVGIQTDVTAATEAENALRDSEAMMRLVLNNVPSRIVYTDSDLNYRVANRQFKDWYHPGIDNVIGLNVKDVLPPDLYEQLLPLMKQALAGEAVTFERMVSNQRTKETRHFRFHYQPDITPDGHVPGYITVIDDITESKRAEAALRRKENELTDALNIGRMGYWRRDAHKLDVYWSQSVYRAYGLDPHDPALPQDPGAFLALIESLIHPDDRARHLKVRDTALAEQKPYSDEYRFMPPGQPMRTIMVSARPEFDENGNFTGYFGISQDITESKQARRALQESQQRFRDFAESSSDWFWEMDADLRFSWFSDDVELISGLPPEWYIGKTRQEVGFPEEDREVWEQHLATLDRHEPYRDFIYKRNGPNGVKWLKSSGVPVFDEFGNFKGYRGTGSDISTEIEARHEAEAAHNLFIEAIERMPLGIAYFDDEDRLRRANAEFRTELPSDDWMGVTFEELLWQALNDNEFPIPEEQRESWAKWRLYKHRNPSAAPLRVQRSGRWFDVYEHNLIDGGTLCLWVDVTKTLEQEQERRRAQRLEAMGIMVGGLAHEMNNLLQPIRGLSEMALQSVEDDSLAHRALQGILQSSSRANALLQGMLKFGRKTSEPLSEPQDLNEMLSEALQVISTLSRGGTELSVNAARDIGMARISSLEFTQVLLNLVKNALDALNGQGEIVIGLEPLAGEPRMARLSVADNGPGIPQKIAENVFEPFFTTKDVDKGTGLGLSVVHGIVSDWDGSIRLLNPDNGGTRFEIDIPLD